MAGLVTPRLRLRLLSDGDETLYCRLFCDPAVMQRIAPPQSLETARRGFRTACRMNLESPPTRRFWVIGHAARGEDIGLLGLHWDGTGGAEVGATLPDAEQGQGIAAEAIAALADHAFTTLGLVHLHTRHSDGHERAAGLMRKLGFDASFAMGDAHACRWSLTPASWAIQRERWLA